MFHSRQLTHCGGDTKGSIIGLPLESANMFLQSGLGDVLGPAGPANSFGDME